MFNSRTAKDPLRKIGSPSHECLIQRDQCGRQRKLALLVVVLSERGYLPTNRKPCSLRRPIFNMRIFRNRRRSRDRSRILFLSLFCPTKYFKFVSNFKDSIFRARGKREPCFCFSGNICY